MTPMAWTGSGAAPTGPRSVPTPPRTEVVGKLISLRQHDHFGPAKIAMYLKRYHDIQISNSGVWRILKRLELNRLPASQRHQRHDRRWQRYEQPLPGHRVQLDVSSSPRCPDHGASTTSSPPSTTAPGCGSCASTPSSTSRRPSFLDYVLERLPFGVEVIQTDNGVEFGPASTGTSWTRASAMSTSSHEHRGSMARSNAPIASTPRSSTACWTGW
jgi:hypothetical protein